MNVGNIHKCCNKKKNLNPFFPDCSVTYYEKDPIYGRAFAALAQDTNFKSALFKRIKTYIK